MEQVCEHLRYAGSEHPLNLHQEHLNRICKTCIECLGVNKRGETIVRSSKLLMQFSLLLTKTTVFLTSLVHTNTIISERPTNSHKGTPTFKGIQSHSRPTMPMFQKPYQHYTCKASQAHSRLPNLHTCTE